MFAFRKRQLVMENGIAGVSNGRTPFRYSHNPGTTASLLSVKRAGIYSVQDIEAQVVVFVWIDHSTVIKIPAVHSFFKYK